jgi:hypothetical protein
MSKWTRPEWGFSSTHVPSGFPYLVFNEGYASSSGDQLPRTELSDEAIRLT